MRVRAAYCGDEGGVIRARRRIYENVARHSPDDDLAEALEQAAERYDGGGFGPRKARYTKAATATFKRNLKRFLEQMPAGMTLGELLDQL